MLINDIRYFLIPRREVSEYSSPGLALLAHFDGLTGRGVLFMESVRNKAVLECGFVDEEFRVLCIVNYILTGTSVTCVKDFAELRTLEETGVGLNAVIGFDC